MNLNRTTVNHKKCAICNKINGGKKNYKLHRINDKAVVDAYIKTSILIPLGSRACRIHFDEFGFLSKRYLI